MRTQHELKTINPYFERVWNCSKTFELRKNDRDFQGGDTVRLREYDQKTNTYSGREIYADILYVIYNHESLADGYVCFSINCTEWISAK